MKYPSSKENSNQFSTDSLLTGMHIVFSLAVEKLTRITGSNARTSLAKELIKELDSMKTIVTPFATPTMQETSPSDGSIKKTGRTGSGKWLNWGSKGSRHLKKEHEKVTNGQHKNSNLL